MNLAIAQLQSGVPVPRPTCYLYDLRVVFFLDISFQYEIVTFHKKILPNNVPLDHVKVAVFVLFTGEDNESAEVIPLMFT